MTYKVFNKNNISVWNRLREKAVELRDGLLFRRVRWWQLNDVIQHFNEINDRYAQLGEAEAMVRPLAVGPGELYCTDAGSEGPLAFSGTSVKVMSTGDATAIFVKLTECGADAGGESLNFNKEAFILLANKWFPQGFDYMTTIFTWYIKTTKNGVPICYVSGSDPDALDLVNVSSLQGLYKKLDLHWPVHGVQPDDPGLKVVVSGPECGEAASGCS